MALAEKNVAFVIQDENELCYLMGKALYEIQHLEEALNHSYTLQLNAQVSKQQADSILEKNRSNTLGEAIKFTKKEELYSDSLQQELEVIRAERNWLVHKIVPHNLKDMSMAASKDRLFDRVKAISNKAQALQQIIEDGMLEFCEANGKDMTETRAAISKLRKS
jgi:hypothetical protein